jgi:hypothetical protein
MRIASSALRRFGFGLAASALVFASHSAHAEPRPCAGVDYNAMILDIIHSLPTGGGYSIGSDFVAPVIQTHNIGGGRHELRVYDGFPSHCTSATYALYSHLVAVLHNSGRINLTADNLRSLAVRRSLPDGSELVDGQGPFWIFNANGAGVAAFLKHTGTGQSFRDDQLAYARPGDFLKLFWNEGVGASEQGHQVVYLGHRTDDGREMICFWGSQRQNKKKRGKGTEALYFPASDGGKVVNGYGEACRPRADIKAMIFSRVTCMENLAAGLDSMRARADARGFGPMRMPRPFEDEFLVSLSRKSSDQATLDRHYDIRPAPSEFANLAPPAQ